MPDFSALRSMVNLFLTDSCTITRPVAPLFDSGTYDDDDIGDLVYEGACRLQPFRRANTREVGEAQVYTARFICKLPWDADGIGINDLVALTASSDPHFVGRVFRVTDVQGETQNAQRELCVEDILTTDLGETGS